MGILSHRKETPSSTEAEGKMDEKKKEEEDNEGVPIDTGWGWVIAFCGFLNFSIVIGFNRAMSVLFIDVMEVFDQSATLVSLAFTIHAVTACVSTILTSNIIMVRYTVRRISVIVALVNSLGTICISQAPNIAVYLLMHSIKGAAFGCLLICPISMIGYYFKKRRNLALSIANSGFCAAFIAFPPITEILRSEFGLRGCLVLISAIELHLIAVMMLLRPPSSYKKLYHHKMNLQARQESQLKPLLSSSYPPMNKTDHANNLEKIINNGFDIKETKGDENITKTLPMEGMQSRSLYSLSQRGLNLDNVSPDTENHQLSPKIKVDLVSEEKSSHVLSEQRENEARGIEDLSSQCKEMESNTMLSNRHMKKGNLDSHLNSSLRNLRALSLHLVSDINISGSQFSLSAQDDVLYYTLASSTSLANIRMNEKDGGTETFTDGEANGGPVNERRCCIRNLIDLTLFKIWLFRMMAIFIPISSAINFLTIYMPVFALDVGLSKNAAALNMTISGVVDLVLRLFIGFVADLKCISKSKMVIGSLLVLTLLCQTSRFFLSKDTFVVFAIVVGAFGGFRQNLMASMITDYVGVDRMAKGYAFCAMLTALFLSSNFPILGAMLDVSGHFIIPLHYTGIWLFVSIIILACEPFFKRMDKKRHEHGDQIQGGQIQGDQIQDDQVKGDKCQ